MYNTTWLLLCYNLVQVLNIKIENSCFDSFQVAIVSILYFYNVAMKYSHEAIFVLFRSTLCGTTFRLSSTTTSNNNNHLYCYIISFT